MPCTKISENLYSVGILNPAMRIFDIVMTTDYGTSYNSYIIKGSEKTALIEVSHADFFERYLDNIKEVCDPSEIDYIILNHCEPDHSGALAELLKVCSAKIVATAVGANYLKAITNDPQLDIMTVRDGDSIDLGGGTVLEFKPSAFLHWPDSMFTWCESKKTLFSCDMFGCHYCEPYVFDKYIAYDKAYGIALKGYYDAIFGPFKPHVLKGLEKIGGLDIETICSSHGPVLTKGGKLEEVMKLYKEWSTQKPKTDKLVPVFYTSAYGNTAKIAQAVAKGIRSAISGVQCEIYDINEYDMGYLSSLLNSSDAFAIGSPTINSDAAPPVWNLLSHVDAINNRRRPALVFGSYGWSGEAVGNITARLQGLRSDVYKDGFKAVFVPSKEDLKNAEALGKEFGEKLSAQ